MKKMIYVLAMVVGFTLGYTQTVQAKTTTKKVWFYSCTMCDYKGKSYKTKKIKKIRVKYCPDCKMTGTLRAIYKTVR